MEVTALTWIVAVGGLALIGLLAFAELIALFRPRGESTVRNVYGGDPGATDPTAYFAFNQGFGRGVLGADPGRLLALVAWSRSCGPPARRPRGR